MAHTLPLTITLDDLTITVAYDEGFAGVTGGPPDAWQPPEPPEVEVISATDADGNPVELDGDDDEMYDRIIAACNEPLKAIYDAEAEAAAALDAEINAAADEYGAMLRAEGLL